MRLQSGDVSQVLVVMLYVIWVAGAPTDRLPRGPIDAERLVVFFSGFAVLVAIPAFAARWLTRRMAADRFWTVYRQFHWLIETVKVGMAAWFALGVFGVDAWIATVGRMVGPLGDGPFMLPGMLIGPLPALLAWVALWWAQFPMERLAREQSVLPLLESDLPVHAPPSGARFFSNNLRMQILSTAVPLLLIALLRDIAAVVLLLTKAADPQHPVAGGVISLLAAAGVLLIAPEPLRHILRTQKLPHSSLRWRLDAICRAARTRYRDVLLWNTGYAVGNAAVMGVLPRVRYVLLSDLLLETMTDRQIEGVFSHELGHVVYRHTVWFVVLIVSLMLLMSGAGQLMLQAVSSARPPPWVGAMADGLVGVGAIVLAVLVFGFVSRRFERQADVYAARLMQGVVADPAAARPIDARRGTVGPEGAEIVASALARAAAINNMPLEARSFRHGSIARRIRFLRTLANEPSKIDEFDRSMLLLFGAILASAAVGAASMVLAYAMSA